MECGARLNHYEILNLAADQERMARLQREAPGMLPLAQSLLRRCLRKDLDVRLREIDRERLGFRRW